MAKCPVCCNVYVEGQIKYCSKCEWDLTPFPPTFTGQIPKPFLDREQEKLTWARNLWEQLQNQLSELHSAQKRADTEKIQLLKSELDQTRNQMQTLNQEYAGLRVQFRESNQEKSYIDSQKKTGKR